MWRPCLITDQDKLSHRYRGPSIEASYQVSVHLAKRFQRRIFFSSANQKHELPVVAMFVNGSGHTEQSLYRTFHRCFLSNSKNQNPVHLAEGFQRRRLKCEKLADDKWWQKLTLPLARWAKNNLWCSIKNGRLRGLQSKGYHYWKAEKILKTKRVQ